MRKNGLGGISGHYEIKGFEVAVFKMVGPRRSDL